MSYEALAENNRHTHANLTFCIEQRQRLEARVTELEDALARIERVAGEGIGDVDLYEAITDLTRIGYSGV